MQRIKPILLFATLTISLFGQETKITKTTEIYDHPGADTNIGQLNVGTVVKKLRLDRSGTYVKATLDFYIPINALEDSRVSRPVGTIQVADKAKFLLLDARQSGNSVKLKLQVTNVDFKDELVFTAMAMLKVIGANGNRAELNPFEGKHQDMAIIRPLKSVVAELVFDFKTPPKNVSLICKSKLDGEEIIYSLGF